MTKVIKVKLLTKDENHNTKYFIDFGYSSKKGSLRLFDISVELNEANKYDKADGHMDDTGPRFGWDIYRACQAADAFLVVESAWEKALENELDFDAENIKPLIGFKGGWRHIKKHKLEIIKEWAV